MLGDVTGSLENYRFNEAANRIYEFLWHEFADWYVEIAKTEKNASVLHYVLSVILKLSHPLMPFVSEEIWQRWHGSAQKNMLMIQQWPRPEKQYLNPSAEKDFTLDRMIKETQKVYEN